MEARRRVVLVVGNRPQGNRPYLYRRCTCRTRSRESFVARVLASTKAPRHRLPNSPRSPNNPSSRLSHCIVRLIGLMAQISTHLINARIISRAVPALPYDKPRQLHAKQGPSSAYSASFYPYVLAPSQLRTVTVTAYRRQGLEWRVAKPGCDKIHGRLGVNTARYNMQTAGIPFSLC